MNFKIFLFIFLLINTFVFSQERYKDSVFSNIASDTYEYAVKDTTSLKLDFYQAPLDTLEKRPLFIFVHGGGFSSGKRDHKEIIKLAKQVAARGYVVASLSYRLTRKGKDFGCDCPKEDKIEAFRAAGEDIIDAILFMLNEPTVFKIDEKKIILTGSSAGAEGILNLAFNKNILFRNQEKYNQFKPAAVISLEGAVLDSRYITASNAIPGVFFHGTADPLVPYASGAHHYCDPNKVGYLMLDGSATIVSKLKNLRKSFLFYTFIDANHDVFKIPFKRLQEIFNFMHRVVINNQYYQASVTVNKGN